MGNFVVIYTIHYTTYLQSILSYVKINVLKVKKMSEKTNKIKPRNLAGFLELLPADQVLFNKIYDKIRTS